MNRNISSALLFLFFLSGCVTTATTQVPVEGVKDALQSQAIVVVGTECRNNEFCGTNLLQWREFLNDRKRVLTKFAIDRNLYPGESNPGFDINHEGTMFGTAGYKMHAIAVQPGTYVLSAAKEFKDLTIYNLASMRFEVRPGEVVYIGNYILRTMRQGGVLTGWNMIDITHTSRLATAQKFVSEKYSADLGKRLKEVTPQATAFSTAGHRLSAMWSVDTEQGQLPWARREQRIRANQDSTFPFKSTVTVTEFEADSRSCSKISIDGGGVSSSLSTTSGAASFAEAFFAHLLIGPSSRRTGGSPLGAGNFRNCMLLHGYDLIEIPDTVKSELAELPIAAQLERVGKLAAASGQTPIGTSPVTAVKNGSTAAVLDAQPQFKRRPRPAS